MRDPNRIPRILNLLRTYWEENPDLRMGQIVVNLTPGRFQRESDAGWKMMDPYHVEDDMWEAILKNTLKEPA